MTTATRPIQVPFFAEQAADGVRRLEATLAADLVVPAGSVLRLVAPLHGAVAAVVVVEPPRLEAAQ